MDKTLYVTDLDGTLLNKQDSISPFSIRTINELVEKGMIFTYATARSLVSASREIGASHREHSVNCTMCLKGVSIA